MSSESTESLICHICMEVYRKPKFLPCYHTFCVVCIQDWANQSLRKGVSTFQCPVCRKETFMPKGGVHKLQSNFYFSEQELEKIRTGKLCLVHRKKDLELFCVPCKEVICLKCKVMDHNSHVALDLVEAAQEKKKELEEGRERVQTAIKTLESLSKEKEAKRKLNQEQLSTAKAVARKIIRTAGNAIRRFTANRLQSCFQYLDSDLSRDLESLRLHQQEMKAVDKQLSEAAGSEDAKKLFTVAEEVNSGKGSKKCVDKMVKSSNRSINQLSLYQFLWWILIIAAVLMVQIVSLLRSDSNQEEVESFEMISSVPFSMVKQFKCAEEKDTRVYSICVTDYSVVMSYAQRGLRADVFSESFSRDGQQAKTQQKTRGKIKWSRVGQVCVSVTDPSKTFSKSKILFILVHTLTCSEEKSEIWKVIEYRPAVSDNMRLSFMFKIKVGPHRTFDANSKGNIFAVIEEGQYPNLQRAVKIFKKRKFSPIAVYVPATTTFQPVDLCFYRLVEEEVLLVLDEWSPHMHVVGLKGAGVTPRGYLEAGCPPGRMPTALNVDDDGALWVACQGGSVVRTQQSYLREMKVMVENKVRSVLGQYIG
ncbi:hypothetical protein ACOMHN_001415 [Nucella lapillus]